MSDNAFTPLNPAKRERRSRNLTGFTLIEVIMAVSMITAGVIGVFVVVQQVANFTSISSTQLTAIYIAQEGVEIIKNIRDTNWLDPEGRLWDSGLADCLSGPPCEWEADYTLAFSPWNEPGRFLKIEGGFYKYSDSPGAAVTPFKRKIIIEPDGSDILNVTVVTSWQERGRSHQLSVQNVLYNWHLRQ